MNAGVASAFVTLASVSTMAYQFTSLMLYKAAEVGANTAIRLIRSRGSSVAETIGEVQFILTELDIEAKFRTVRSLLSSVRESFENTPSAEKDFISICVSNVEDAMALVSETLVRIQNAMDGHVKLWFSSYRTLNVVEDLSLLKVQCRMFDKRLEVLIQCLSVPLKAQKSAQLHRECDMMEQRIFGEPYDSMDEYDGLDRMKGIMMAERALRDAKFQDDNYVETKTTISENYNSLLFEDPVFL